MSFYDVVIVGGGAAGFFTAINAAEQNRNLHIAILERGSEVLGKVKVSGGGRCNVTHAEFLPKELTQNYPRGQKELLGPFHTFMTGDTVAWFENRGVVLKIEEDGRMFPVSDSSQTIIDCFTGAAEQLGISVLKNHSVKSLRPNDGYWQLQTSKGDFTCRKLVVATGSNPKIWNLLQKLGHTIVPPVPSLFTFNIEDARLAGLAGISTRASITVLETSGRLEAQGPLLITHWGISGPAVLKLSAWGARLLAPTNYQFAIEVNWLPDHNQTEVFDGLKRATRSLAKKTVAATPLFDLPKRLWKRLVVASHFDEKCTWAHVSQEQLRALHGQLMASHFQVTGKSTFKEEFVTAGGVLLREIDFKRFESKLHPNLFLVGEVLDIDAITGGFNFQNAWTGGFLAANALADC
jgi:predicted Rossmann fold flavoprotein